MERLISLLGVLATIGIAWLFSENKKRVPWKLVLWAVVMQFVFAFIVLKTGPGELLFSAVRDLIKALLDYTDKGSTFVFGSLNDPSQSWGFIFAVKVLPTIIFFSALTSVLYYLGIMQKIVQGIAWVMIRILGTSGAETLCAAGNIFLGQTEAPLLIKPFIPRLTRSELMVVMVSGFGTIAVGVMGVYAVILNGDTNVFPDAAGHLLAASVMSAPCALMISKLLLPETEVPETQASGALEPSSDAASDPIGGAGEDSMPMPAQETPKEANVIDAAAAGASQGLMLALNVGAMLIVFIAFVSLIDGVLSKAGGVVGYPQFGLDDIFNVVFVPFAWLIGVPMSQTGPVASLMGQKLVINEFFAYLNLAEMIKDPNCQLSGRTIMLALYALCGFSNFSSIGIQIAGIGGLAPGRRSDMARLGMLALLGGTLVCLQTAAIAGVMIGEGEVPYNRPVPLQAPVHPKPETRATPSPAASESPSPASPEAPEASASASPAPSGEPSPGASPSS